MYIFAEILGNICKYYDSVDDLIDENVSSLFDEYDGAVVINKKLTKADLKKLLQPKNKTYGTFFVRYAPENSNEILEYAIPFNDDAMEILDSYNATLLETGWRDSWITVIDLDKSYSGKYKSKAEELDISNYRSTDTTIKLALFTLTGKYRDYICEKIKSVTGVEVNIVGEVNNELTKSIHFVLDNNPNYKQHIDDILTGKLGVIEIESSW